MFNVIIITIFRGSSSTAVKPSTEDFDGFLSFPHFVYEATCEENCYYCSDIEDDGDDEYHGYDGYDEDNDDDGGSDYGVDSEDDDHHQQENKDLERRIEEFIAMNYKQRKEELIYERLLTW
ncbi:hypothetical protein SLA2020_448310 [Shorea laevis]